MPVPRLFPAYIIPVDQQKSQAALVPRIRAAVHQWRREAYPGVTDTTKKLLTHWFESDHQSHAGEPWLYYYCQREAVETTVYLYEALKKRTLYELAMEFAANRGQISLDPIEDLWTRYAYKMATGSGKTKVMSLLIAWSYFNSKLEPQHINSEYSDTFILLAPNVIVYERLKQDFGDGGRIFRTDPVIPPELRDEWQMEVATRDEPTLAGNLGGVILLTNVQQFYGRPSSAARNMPPQLRDIIGEPVTDSAVSAGLMMRQSLEHRNRLMVLNDEGHHVHDPKLRWSETIKEFDDSLRNRTGQGLMMQLDFSATPKHNDGKLFGHVIVDYPIAQAIRDGVVKRPHLVELSGAVDYSSENAADRYRDRLIVAVNRWQELREHMNPIKREPLLFVMTEDTKSADQIGEWLRGAGGFKPHEVLVIHTNARGEITEGASTSKQREIALLRESARDVDSGKSQYKAIVSVLMLREGWDVKNVCVILPLRPYSAESRILPEQTLGRGLRRMFSISSGNELEELLVIDHEAFRSFWDREIKEENIPMLLSSYPDFTQTAVTVLVNADKAAQFEITIPRLTPRLAFKAPDLSRLDVEALPVHRLQLPVDGLAEEPIPFITRDMDTWEEVGRGEIDRDFPLSEAGYLNYMCRLILKECRLSNLSNGFMQLAPKVKRYIEAVLFASEREISDKSVLHRLNDPGVKLFIMDLFVKTIRELSIMEMVDCGVENQFDPICVSRTKPFVTRRQVIANPKKSVFTHVVCDSDLERDFARWMDDIAKDVAAFAKNEAAVGFSVNYVSAAGGLRSYFPDFIVRASDGKMYVLETKGLTTEEVPRKDARVAQWCRDASAVTGVEWRYKRIDEQRFRSESAWQTLREMV